MKNTILIILIVVIAGGGGWYFFIRKSKTAEEYKQDGWDFYDAGEFDKASKAFRKSIELDPDYSLPHFGLGCCYKQQEDYEEAKKWFMKTLELDSDYHTARIAYASCLILTAKDKKEAVKEGNIELGKIPKEVLEDGNVAYNVAAYCAIAGNSELALKYLAYAIEKIPATADDAAKDKDFDGIRDMPEFKRLVD